METLLSLAPATVVGARSMATVPKLRTRMTGLGSVGGLWIALETRPINEMVLRRAEIVDGEGRTLALPDTLDGLLWGLLV